MSLECIFSRRSIRDFSQQAISPEDLHQLLQAGMAAPSAMNKQPWEFVVIQDKQRKESMAAICPYWKSAKNAPVVIVVCANLEDQDEVSKTFFVQDCSAASENILCAAAAMKLGGVWLGTYGLEDRMKAVGDLLSLPEFVYPVSVLAIGHPQKFWNHAIFLMNQKFILRFIK